MYKKKKILSIIPARSGSKGIPHKNITLINGKPLIDYTISEALKSNYLDFVMVSTDSKEIAEIAEYCGAEVPFLREDRLASDEARTIDVMVDVVKRLKESNNLFDYVVLLQPTQPLRKTKHIDNGIKQMIDNNYTSLVSVNEVSDHPILMRTISKGGVLKNIVPVSSTLRRQDFPNYYKVNGALYINKIDENFNALTSLNDNPYPYIMDKKYDLDIDEPYDLELFQWWLNRNQEEKW